MSTPHLGPVTCRPGIPAPGDPGSPTRAQSDLRPMAVIHAEALEENAVLDGEPYEPEWDAEDAAAWWADADASRED